MKKPPDVIYVLRQLAFLCGLAAIVTGLAMVWHPLAVVVGGFLLCCVAAYDPAKKRVK